MIVDEPPVCPRCSVEQQSLAKLEQHARKPTPDSASGKAPRGLLDGGGSRICLSAPLNPEANKVWKQGHATRSMPPWMSLLPSNRRRKEQPQSQDRFRRRSTFPYFDTTRSPGRLETTPQSMDTATMGPLGVSADVPYTPSSGASLQPTDPFASSLYQTQPPGISSKLPGRDSRPLSHRDIPVSNSLLSGRLSQSPSRNGLQPRLDESGKVQPFPTQLLERTPSSQKRRYSLCRPPIASVSSPAPLTEFSDSFTSQPVTPSQDITPAKSPVFKELSGFFASRGAGGKLILPSRVGEGSSRPHARRTATPGRMSRSRRVCGQCGVEMSDWWLRRESADHRRGREGEPGNASRVESLKICSRCKAGISKETS